MRTYQPITSWACTHCKAVGDFSHSEDATSLVIRETAAYYHQKVSPQCKSGKPLQVKTAEPVKVSE